MTYTKDALKQAIGQKLRLNYGCTEQQAGDGEMLKACAMVLRDIMAEVFYGKEYRKHTTFIYDRQVTTSFSIVLFSSSAGSLCGNQYR